MKHFRMLAAGLCSAVLLCGFAIPAYAYSDREADAQREHVLALDHRLVVQSHVGERLPGHRGDVGHHDVVVLPRLSRRDPRPAGHRRR